MHEDRVPGDIRRQPHKTDRQDRAGFPDGFAVAAQDGEGARCRDAPGNGIQKAGGRRDDRRVDLHPLQQRRAVPHGEERNQGHRLTEPQALPDMAADLLEPARPHTPEQRSARPTSGSPCRKRRWGPTDCTPTATAARSRGLRCPAMTVSTKLIEIWASCAAMSGPPKVSRATASPRRRAASVGRLRFNSIRCHNHWRAGRRQPPVSYNSNLTCPVMTPYSQPAQPRNTLDDSDNVRSPRVRAAAESYAAMPGAGRARCLALDSRAQISDNLGIPVASHIGVAGKAPKGARFDSPGAQRSGALGLRSTTCAKPQRGEIPAAAAHVRGISPRWGFPHRLLIPRAPHAARPGLSNLAPFGALRSIGSGKQRGAYVMLVELDSVFPEQTAQLLQSCRPLKTQDPGLTDTSVNPERA